MSTHPMASAGTLDQEFGIKDVVSISVPGYPYPNITSVGIGPDKKIYFAGTGEGGTEPRVVYVLGRLNEDGTTDTTFGTAGLAIGHVPGASLINVKSFAFQPDASLVILGNASGLEYYDAPFLARYDADGKLDTSFGTDGHCLLIINLAPPAGFISSSAKNYRESSTASDNASGAQGVVILPDGKILAFKQHMFNLALSHGLIIRLTQDGSLDPEFNQLGYIAVIHPDYLHHRTLLRNIMVQADGKYLGCGNVGGGEHPRALMFVRYDTTGIPDVSFGGKNGFVTIADDQSAVEWMVQQPNRRILGVGNAYSAPTKGMMISIEHDGSPNIQFNRGEAFYTDLEPGAMTAWEGAALQRNGRIVTVGGVGQFNGEVDIVVARFIDAQFDPDFNNGQGWVRTRLANGAQYATGVTLQEDGKIVVCAFASASRAVILRYHA
ncbi:delta-60 repeat domain-containing protein [Pseudomonas frederiksbergensis]|uniref:delta-60 repeat domain-containing protein n=1 Tax=Pseudomonas frederiksbergensis TaxID=104087 RepID=UPI003D0080D5